MPNYTEIGTVDWTNDDLRKSLEAFSRIWDKRPLKDNPNGIHSCHAYAIYFMVRHLKPKVIIESGVLFGLSTWLFEQAAPDAKIIALDPIRLRDIKYQSKNAEYHVGEDFVDFDRMDWSDIDKETALVYFDDHYGTDRISAAFHHGFRNVIFEDNYHGWGAGQMNSHPDYLATRIDTKYAPKACFEQNLPEKRFLEAILDCYYEFPPIVTNDGGARWQYCNHIERSKEPLYLNQPIPEAQEYFGEDAGGYTWISWMRLKSASECNVG